MSSAHSIRSSPNGRNQESDFPRKRSTLRIGLPAEVPGASVMPDDHSEVVPLLPIPNRTVKRLCADDSAGSRVKVGHRQAVIRGAPFSRRGVLICALGSSCLER